MTIPEDGSPRICRMLLAALVALAIAQWSASAFAQAVGLTLLNPGTGTGQVEIVQGDIIEVQFEITDASGTDKNDIIRIRQLADSRVVGSKKRGDFLSGTVSLDARTKAKMQGYEGDPCGECGNYTLVRNGTCMKCNTCGGTSGCS